MAVQESGTPMYARQIMRHLDGEVKMTAFRAKNPSLASQLEMVKDNPRQLKKLSAESACELVEMVSDPSLLETLHELDTRVSVRDSIASTLKEINGRVLDNDKNRKPTSVSEKTAKFLKKSPAQAAERISSAQSLDVPMVLEWCRGLSSEDLAIFAGHLGYCYPMMAERENWVAFQKLLVEKLSEGDASVLSAASNRLESEVLLEALLEAPEELSLFLTIATSVVLHQTPTLVKDNKLIIKRTNAAGASFVKSECNAAMQLWFGLITAKQALKSLSKDDEYEGWQTIAAVTNATDANLLLEKADKFGWLDASDDRSFYRYHSTPARYAGVLFDIKDLDEKWLVKLAPIVAEKDLRSFLFQKRICKPSAEVIDEIASSVDAESVNDLLAMSSYSRDPEEEYDPAIIASVVSRFVNLTPGLPHQVGSQGSYRYYWGQRTSLLSPVLASVLTEAFQENTSCWAVFWGLVESCHETATFQELIMAAEALSA